MKEIPWTVHWKVDSGHAWLKVPKKVLSEEQIDRISTYSYETLLHYYLEEDCDAEIYLSTLDEETRRNIREKYYDRWRGRGYQRVRK